MRVGFGEPRTLRTSEARPAFSHGPQTGARPSHFDFLRRLEGMSGDVGKGEDRARRFLQWLQACFA